MNKDIRNLLIITMGLNHGHFNFTLSNFLSNFLEDTKYDDEEEEYHHSIYLYFFL